MKMFLLCKTEIIPPILGAVRARSLKAAAKQLSMQVEENGMTHADDKRHALKDEKNVYLGFYLEEVEILTSQPDAIKIAYGS